MKNFIKALRILAHIKYAVKHYSNDMQLGEYIRKFVTTTSKKK